MAQRFRLEVPFTQIANVVLRDKKLSLKAKGLFGYLYSKPADWKFAARRITNEHRDGYESVLSALDELEENGYLIRDKNGNGTMQYYLSYDKKEKVLKNKEKVAPKVGKPHSGETRPISNTDVLVIKNLSATPSEDSSAKQNTLLKMKNKFYQEDSPNFHQEKTLDLDGNPVKQKPKNEKDGSIASVMAELLRWAEQRRGRKFVNIMVQYIAMKRMRLAGISSKAVKERWLELEEDRYWAEKGFDFMTIANSFDKKP